MSYRVMYLRDRNGQNVGCVAMEETDDNYTEFQVSVLNPTDRFNREVARTLAIGRLVEKPLNVRVGGKPSRHDIARAVMRAISKDSGMPSRARRAAHLWLKTKPV